MMNFDHIIPNIRKLAKRPMNQTLFSMSKEMSIRLFENEWDFTFFQITFVRYLNFYNTINLDIALKEIDEEVLDNKIFEDNIKVEQNCWYIF